MTKITVVVEVHGPDAELKNNSETVRQWVKDELDVRMRHAPFFIHGLTVKTLVSKAKGNPK